MSLVSNHYPECLEQYPEELPYRPHTSLPSRREVERRLTVLVEQALVGHVQPFGQPLVSGEDD
jgi:hypothetical protein